MNNRPRTAPWYASLGHRWQALQARERIMVALAASVVGAALLWLWAIEPAWKTHQSYGRERLALERQIQHMQDMRQRAVQLQAQLSGAAQQGDPATVGKALEEQAKAALGPEVQTVMAGARLTVRVHNAPATALAAWLHAASERARSHPVQVQLTRQGDDAPARWSGEVLWALPPAGDAP